MRKHAVPALATIINHPWTLRWVHKYTTTYKYHI